MKIPEKVKGLNRTKVLLLILALTILINIGIGNSKKCDMKKIEEQGVSNETHDLLVDVYVLNQPSYADEDVESLFNELNPIWEQYGIKFNVTNITRLDNADLKPRFSIKVCIEGGELSDNESLAFATPIVGSKLYTDRIIDIIFVDGVIWCTIEIPYSDYKLPLKGLMGTDGMGFRPDNTNIIVFNTKSKNASWTLAHEFGHALNLLDKPVDGGKCNLMMGKDFWDKQHSTFLNQSQVDRVVLQARDLEHYK